MTKYFTAIVEPAQRSFAAAPPLLFIQVENSAVAAAQSTILFCDGCVTIGGKTSVLIIFAAVETVLLQASFAVKVTVIAPAFPTQPDTGVGVFGV